MNEITFDTLKQAAGVFQRIAEIRSYVTRERFDKVARMLYDIDDDVTLDVMYGMLNMTPQLVYYLANYDDENLRKQSGFPKRLALLPKTIEIAVAAYRLKAKGWSAESVPAINHDKYRREDMRRYYYTKGDTKHILDVRLGNRSDILLLSELLQRDDVTLRGTTEHLGHLEGEMKGRDRERFQYFEGDIYLLYGNPTDRLFYSYLHSDDAGVYVATQKGWRKLLYTPTRGYVTRSGELDFADDKHFYSDYMLEGSGKGFLYVGNIHDDVSVLMEKGKEE